jgi:glycosyltransferase involved in cell wall biosynthesis
MENLNKPLVSIWCTAFNHEKYIHDCLASFINQKTNFHFEIIVHDDASTDKTQEIIKIFELQNRGLFNNIYQTENQFKKSKSLIPILSKISRGKYIALCDGDDYWTDPLKLQKQVEFLEGNENVSACFHDAWILNEISNTKEPFPILEKELLETEDLIKFGWTIPTHSLVFRNDSLPIPDWFNYIKNGDYSLQLILSLSGPLYKFNEKMGVYRQHPNGLHNSFSKNRVYLKNQVLKVLYFFNYYSNFKYDNLITKTAQHHLESIIELPVKPNKNTRDDRPLAAKCFSKSFWKRKINEWL